MRTITFAFTLALMLIVPALYGQGKKGDSLPTPELPTIDLLGTNAGCMHDTAFAAEYQQAQKKLYEYYAKKYTYYGTSFDHTQGLFNWQLLSSKIIFGVVILIVLCGLVFSGIHFFNHLKASGRKEQARTEKKASTAELKEGEPGNAAEAVSTLTQMEISTTGIKINSSVLGIIILFLSLAFFFLYLSYVYQIKTINFDTVPLDNSKIYSVPELPVK